MSAASRRALTESVPVESVSSSSPEEVPVRVSSKAQKDGQHSRTGENQKPSKCSSVKGCDPQVPASSSSGQRAEGGGRPIPAHMAQPEDIILHFKND